ALGAVIRLPIVYPNMIKTDFGGRAFDFAMVEGMTDHNPTAEAIGRLFGKLASNPPPPQNRGRRHLAGRQWATQVSCLLADLGQLRMPHRMFLDRHENLLPIAGLSAFKRTPLMPPLGSFLWNERKYQGTLAVEAIAKVRRTHFVDCKSIRQICLDLQVSRNTVRIDPLAKWLGRKIEPSAALQPPAANRLPDRGIDLGL
ncbi:hypothetical protein AB9K41_03665, partial [Cribrihabitans sp. XS_ASV171]